LRGGNFLSGDFGSVIGPVAPEIILCVLGLLLLVAGMFLPAHRKATIIFWTCLVGLGTALCSCVMVLAAIALSPEPLQMPNWLGATLRVDEFALVLKILINLATILTILISPEYIQHRLTAGRSEYFPLVVFAALGMTLLVSATDLITIYVAMELTSLVSYVLVGYMKRDPKSTEAGMKYFLVGAASSAIMLYGMSLTYGMTGATDLASIRRAIAELGSPEPMVLVGLILMVAGFGFKLAAAPFHMWAPEAYEGGPTPIVALISVGPKMAGIAVLLHVLEIGFPEIRDHWSALIAAIAAISMVLGNLTAIPQKNIKRMLAYSSIGQIGYILIGVASLPQSMNDWRTSGIIVYLLVYAFMNIGAFAVVTAVSNAGLSDDIEDYRGLAQSSPLLAVALLVFLASLAGLPPTAGLWGKALIFGAAIYSGFTWLAVVGVACSVVSVFYYFNVVRVMFFLKATTPHTFRNTHLLTAGIIIAITGTLFIGVYPEPFIAMARVGQDIVAAR